MNTSSLINVGLCGLSLCAFSICAEAQTATAPDAGSLQSPSGLDSRGLPGVSLARLLQLDARQIARLNRLFQDGESKCATVLRGARDSDAARQNVAAQWQAMRAQARASLPPVQRSQLDAFARDPRFRLRQDDLYQLLVGPIEQPGTSPAAPPFRAAQPIQSLAPAIPDAQARRDWQDARRLAGENARPLQGTGQYGVYGGTGYGGPQVGVYGGYQQGAVGVYGGLGRGGPSIGVSIGRIFGLGRR